MIFFSLLHQKTQSLSHHLSLMLSSHVVPSLSVSPALSHRDESTILHEPHTDQSSSQAASQTRPVQYSHVLTLAGVLGISNSFSWLTMSVWERSRFLTLVPQMRCGLEIKVWLKLFFFWQKYSFIFDVWQCQRSCMLYVELYEPWDRQDGGGGGYVLDLCMRGVREHWHKTGRTEQSFYFQPYREALLIIEVC